MGLLGYLAPGKAAKKEAANKEAAAQTEMNEKSVAPSGTSTPGLYPSRVGTPGNESSPWASRPASLYPIGDFRNAAQDEVLDIKCDMMVNHLYQQQMELLWTAGGHDEGIVLKKSRNQYTCCPSDLDQEPAGFSKAVQMLNVRVSIALSLTIIGSTLTSFLECNDRQYPSYQVVPPWQ